MKSSLIWIQRCVNPDCRFQSTPRGGPPKFMSCPHCRGPLERVIHRTLDSPMLSAALEYLARGWSVIPVGQDKKPLLKTWKPYQKRLPTEDEVRKWWGKDYPAAGIALVCGQVSGGIYVLDIDPRNGGDRSLGGKSLPPGPHSRTLHGGRHHFFRSDIPLVTRQGILSGVDFKGEGSYVVLPPSPGYTWLEEPAGELPELPQWVKDLTSPAESREKTRPRATKIDIPLEQQARFLPEINQAAIRKGSGKKKKIWPAAAWVELRVFSRQVDHGSGFLDFIRASDWLREQGFRASTDFQMGPWDCLAWDVLTEGMGVYWERTAGGKLSLFNPARVANNLGVDNVETRRWHIEPLSNLTNKRQKLARFRNIANYDSGDKPLDEINPIARKTIQQQRSGVSPSTQVSDDRVVGLLNGKRHKVGGKPQYSQRRKEETGPERRQEDSKHWSTARLGPHGRLKKIIKDLEGCCSESACPRFFDDDSQYQKAMTQGPVADDPLVILPQAERRNYRPVRACVDLWREPVSV